MIGNSPNDGVIGRGTAGEPSLDAVHDLLANRRRRDTLASLSDHSRAITLADLAEDVALRESDGPITNVPMGKIQNVQIVLHHVHLPKLVDAGVVEHDRDQDRIRLSEPTDRIERALSVAADGGTER